MIKVVIDDIPPSTNKYIGNSASYEIYRKDKEKWHSIVSSYIDEIPLTPYKKAKITITYYFKDRKRRDPDNYAGKFLLDSLVKNGILADDDFNNVELHLYALVDKIRPRVEIEIESLE